MWSRPKEILRRNPAQFRYLKRARYLVLSQVLHAVTKGVLCKVATTDEGLAKGSCSRQQRLKSSPRTRTTRKRKTRHGQENNTDPCLSSLQVSLLALLCNALTMGISKTPPIGGPEIRSLMHAKSTDGGGLYCSRTSKKNPLPRVITLSGL